jgi:hypothetical protein
MTLCLSSHAPFGGKITLPFPLLLCFQELFSLIDLAPQLLLL